MYVCVCNAVTDGDIKQAAMEGVSSIKQLRQQLNVGTCCGRCVDCARSTLDQELNCIMPVNAVPAVAI